jgi:hydrogenase nickel incorporation protein HypB
MCTTCGCEGNENKITMTVFGEKNETKEHHKHDHHHHHEDHHHHHEHTHLIDIETDILSQNNLLAERNRGYFEAKNIFSVNMMSSPGSGKTTLLERTIKDLKNKAKLYIIEGDQQTMNDADRIGKAGAPVIQVNTGNGCHLDADMINKAVKKLNIEDDSIVFIENVGNLVCPSLFDLGEAKRVVIMSVTEGEDKPIKYPTMFEKADVCVINKIDLLPYLNYDVEAAKNYALRVNHHLKFIEVSATTGEGMEKWNDMLLNEFKEA